MKGLTVYQPHAAMLATGARVIETRGWQTKYRGELLIHAARQRGPQVNSLQLDVLEKAACGYVDPNPTLLEEMKKLEGGTSVDVLLDYYVFGGALAVAELHDCRPIERFQDAPEATFADKRYGGWGRGRYGLFLRNLRPLEIPIKMPGRQTLWNVSPEQEALIREQMRKIALPDRPASKGEFLKAGIR